MARRHNPASLFSKPFSPCAQGRTLLLAFSLWIMSQLILTLCNTYKVSNLCTKAGMLESLITSLHYIFFSLFHRQTHKDFVLCRFMLLVSCDLFSAIIAMFSCSSRTNWTTLNNRWQSKKANVSLQNHNGRTYSDLAVVCNAATLGQTWLRASKHSWAAVVFHSRGHFSPVNMVTFDCSLVRANIHLTRWSDVFPH